jgi:integrase
MVRNPTSVRRVRRRGVTSWQIDFTYVDDAGRERRYRRDAKLQTAAGARAEAARLHALAVTTGRLEPRRQAPTVASFARGQFETLFVPKYRASTRGRYLGLLGDLIGFLGQRRLDELGATDARALAANLVGRGVSVKPHVNMLKTILRAAHEVGVIEDVPKLPRLHKEGRKLPHCPSRNEVERMLEGATGWLRVAVALAAYAGLRLGEVRALEVQDVDLEQAALHVRGALSENELVTPKSGHERLVPLAGAVRGVLEVATQAKLPRARIVTTRDGTTPGRSLVLRRFKALQRRLGLPGWSFHSLRHHFISELVRAGASVEAVRLLAGHSKLDVTQRYPAVKSRRRIRGAGAVQCINTASFTCSPFSGLPSREVTHG